MKEEKYLKLLYDYKIEELEKVLKEEIRKGIALKTNSKSRISAVNKLQKYNAKHGQLNLLNTRKINNYYTFTDSYRMYFLNDSLGYHENDKFPDTTSFTSFDRSNIVDIDVNDIIYTYKTLPSKEYKEKPYFISGIDYQGYNVEYLKEVIDVLGTDLRVYNMGNSKPLYFVNDKEEIALILPIKIR